MNENTQPISFHEELLEQLQPRLYGYILSLIANPSDSKDVLQESNRVILAKIVDFKHPNKFDAWAFKIAYYQSLSFLQKRKSNQLTFDASLLETIAHESEAIDSKTEEKLSNLERCLSQLQDRTRTIVSDYYFHNNPIKQIARERNLKINHVAQVLFRARKALFTCITEMETKNHE